MSLKPTTLPERLTASQRPHRAFHIWIAVALGVLVTCAILTACVIVTSQVYIQLALVATPTASTTPTPIPTATGTPVTPYRSATPLLTDTPSPTLTMTPANRPVNTPTRTRGATTSPKAIPTARNVTFKFDAGVTVQERSAIQRDIALAQSQLGDAGPVTILAFSSLETLADEADKFYGRSATSTGSTDLREMFSSGKWLANGGSGAISIWVSDRWLKQSPATRQKTIIHEYYHNVQAALAKRGVTLTGPIWLYEGAADFAAFAKVADTGAVTLDQVHADKVTQSRGMLSPLSSIITLQDTEAEDTEDPYQLGYLAVEYLVSPFGDKQLDTLAKFWQMQGGGATWREAFKSTFGLAVDDFYDRFESYRRAQFPPFCGSVGAPLAQATPAPPGVRLARQLAPGDMPRSDMPWADPPNVPYVFCASGYRLPWLSATAYRFPKRFAGWIACGANCITIFMSPSDPQGTYNFQIDLPDGRQLRTSFEHKVPAGSGASKP